MGARIHEVIATPWHAMDIATVIRMQLYGNARLRVQYDVVSKLTLILLDSIQAVYKGFVIFILVLRLNWKVMKRLPSA